MTSISILMVGRKKAHNMSPQLTVRILDKNVGFSFNITPLPANDKNWKSKQFYGTKFLIKK